MNLQEKLTNQAQEIYPNEISKGAASDMLQENIKDNIVPIRSNVIAPIDLVPSFAITIGEARSRTALLEEFVRDIMIEGVDYGIIAGCSKPSLLKSGAAVILWRWNTNSRTPFLSLTPYSKCVRSEPW